MNEQPHNYYWSIRACVLDQEEDGKKDYKQTN